MRYLKLAQLYEELSATTKRLEKTEILSKFLRQLTKEDKDILYLLLGEIYPQYDERKIGISDKLVIKSISKSTGTEPKEVVKKWKLVGDLGKVAEELSKQKKQHTLANNILTTEKILTNLRKLPELEGQGTVDKKISLIIELMTSATSTEAKYLARTLIGDLRIGIQESTIRDAIVEAFFEKTDDNLEKVQEAIDKANDIGLVFEISQTGKIKNLEKINLEIGKPIKAMLAQKVSSIEDGFKALGTPCAIEYKYDGFRLIIHKNKDEVKLFTRRLENVTKQFPEIVEYIQKYVKGKNFILDSEVVGFDSKTKEYKPFQEISQRIKRKYNIEELQKKLPVEINVFDILFYNGKSYMQEPFEKRSNLVREIIEKIPYKIIPSKIIITDDKKKAEEFYKNALKDNQEGIMMKSLSAEYKPGRRVGYMLKLKPEERDFDLVITSAEYGTGKRSGWLSSFILSCKDEKENKFLEIGKASTGLKEKTEQGLSFETLTKLIKPLIISEKGREVKIKPKIVVAITYQEIQRSPNYSSGFALRFPRIMSLRNDRRAEEITTLKEIEGDYLKQTQGWKYS